MYKKTLELLVICIILVTSFGLLFADTAREIMERVDKNSRERNESIFSILKISTCRYGVKDQKVKCSVNPTVKTVESIAINDGPHQKDNKVLHLYLNHQLKKVWAC